MQVLSMLMLSGLFTFLFDFAWFKWEQKKEVDKSWKDVNDKREREGKQRWDNQ